MEILVIVVCSYLALVFGGILCIRLFPGLQKEIAQSAKNENLSLKNMVLVYVFFAFPFFALLAPLILIVYPSLLLIIGLPQKLVLFLTNTPNDFSISQQIKALWIDYIEDLTGKNYLEPKDRQ